MTRFKHLFACGLISCLISPWVQAAIPSLTQIADDLANMRTHFAEATNAVSQMRERLTNATNVIAQIVGTFEAAKNLRERFHGGRIGQYVFSVTNETGNGRQAVRLINVELYRDGSVWTNAADVAAVRRFDPEAAAKAIAAAAAEAERVRAAWERENLPPALAAIREAQRQAATTQNVAVVVGGN